MWLVPSLLYFFSDSKQQIQVQSSLMDSDEHTADTSFYNIEFRSTANDSWYSARAVMEDDSIIINLQSFPKSSEKFTISDFKTFDSVDDFIHRFRSLSNQLQDTECSKVIKGMKVCASYAFSPNDIRFYDALVEMVNNVEHSFVNEEEQCLCGFMLFWQDGPNEGLLTCCDVASICLIQPVYKLDQNVVSFSRMAKKRIEMIVHSSKCVGTCCGKSFNSVKVSKDMEGGPCRKQIGKYYVISIENLEIDLSPLSIVNFLYDHTSIVSQAWVFPSLCSEKFARGVIMLNCRKQLKMIIEFLNLPGRLVISSKGRPWVTTERSFRTVTSKEIHGTSMPVCEVPSLIKYYARLTTKRLNLLHFP
ncbi:uncharacterized protein LOC124934786 [Impatiens glandulifera]|uniref:uncharacterized protein LOC124934786 n=1 Tax=Impatiens glandulifera TaxID=253017 RepID=UPI001FB195B3|nr:uncharacterized protein LOC124934786 [Impatiens glandulifera]